MNYHILLFAFLLFSFNSLADDNHKIVSDQNGNIFVFGSFAGAIDFPSGVSIGDFNNTTERCFIAKYDSTGACLWARDLVGSTANYWASLETGIAPGIGLTLDDSGNVYVTASFKNTLALDQFTTLSTNQFGTAFIAKYTTGGLVAWAKKVEGSNYGVSIESDSFGHIYAVGMFTNDIQDNGQVILSGSNSETEVYVWKMDAAGNSVWINSISGSVNGVNVNSLTILNDQSVFVIGKSGQGGNVMADGQIENIYDGFYVVRFSSSGVAQWVKTFSNAGPFYAGFDRISSNSQGELIAEGQFQDNIDFEGASSPISTTNNNSNPFVVKFDANGNAIWSMISNPQDTGGSGFGNDLEVDNGDNIWFAAKATRFEYPPLQSQFIASNTDIWHIVKLDNAGNGICQIMDDSLGSRPIDIATDQFGNAYFISSFNLLPSSQMVLGKIDPNCSLIWTSSAEVSVSTNPIGVIENAINENLISVFPNPANDFANIDFGEEPVSGRVKLRNTLGELILDVNFENQKDMQLKLDDLSAGSYYLEVSIGEYRVERVKLNHLRN